VQAPPASNVQGPLNGESNLLQTQVQSGEGVVIDQGSISAAEIAASQEIDNMSVSEIIKQRFKKDVHVVAVRTPQEVAQVIIKSPEDANLKQNVEGNTKEQEEFQKKIADIETNRMYTWSDIDKVKKDLWKKLHSVKNVMKQGVTNLAQIVSHHANNAAAAVKRQLPDKVNHILNKI